MTTETFTAPNGVELEINEHDEISLVDDDCQCGWLTYRGAKAVEAYLRQKRDKELDLWRDPENPERFVVYRRPAEDNDVRGRAVQVIDEISGAAYTYWEKPSVWGSPEFPWMMAGVAERYFEAHPAQPKPWMEAKEGEVWILTIDGEEEPPVTASYIAKKLTFLSPYGYTVNPNNPFITAGHRIWPEEN